MFRPTDRSIRRSAATDLDVLTRPEMLGEVIADETGDPRWKSLEARLISGGKSNLTFELVAEPGSLILRRPPDGELLPRAHDMGRETLVQRALQRTSVPVPRIVLEDVSGDLLGVPFYVMEKVEGHVVRDSLPTGYADSTAEKLQLANGLVDVLVELHGIDAEAVGLGSFGKAEGFLERQIGLWTGQWNRSKTHDVPVVDALATKLATMIPRSRRSAIVHGDFRLDNCVMDPVTPGMVSAVLDWEMSSLGDPMTDVAMLLFFWFEPDEAAPILVPSVTRSEGFPAKAHLAERYAERSGVDLDGLVFYEALANFKFAVISQGIASRVVAGAMAGQEFGDLESEIGRFARIGLDKLDGHG